MKIFVMPKRDNTENVEYRGGGSCSPIIHDIFIKADRAHLWLTPRAAHYAVRRVL